MNTESIRERLRDLGQATHVAVVSAEALFAEIPALLKAAEGVLDKAGHAKAVQAEIDSKLVSLQELNEKLAARKAEYEALAAKFRG